MTTNDVMTAAEAAALAGVEHGGLCHEDAARGMRSVVALHARADRFGTSCFDDTREATCWDTERCLRCATFHHAYDPREGSTLCCSCGEGEDVVSHRPPCAPTPETR